MRTINPLVGAISVFDPFLENALTDRLQPVVLEASRREYCIGDNALAVRAAKVGDRVVDPLHVARLQMKLEHPNKSVEIVVVDDVGEEVNRLAGLHLDGINPQLGRPVVSM